MDGVFLDGWSLADLPVRVELGAEELAIFDLGGIRLRGWSLIGLHIDAMQEGDTYHVTHDGAPHEELVLKNRALAEQLLARTKRVTSLPGGRYKLAYGLACLAALGAIMGGLYEFAPLLSRAVALRIPIEHERALGAELDFVLTLDRCENRAAEQALRELVGKLAGTAKYEVRIVSMSAPNAFALPGGVVLVTEGLLQQAGSVDEIAGVLAHEVEHIEQRHVLAGALRDVLLTAMWAITFGDYSGLLVVDPSTAYRIANLEFTREDEASADAGAIARLHRAGASHRGLLRFFQRVKEAHGSSEGPAWLSSHPSTAARIRALEEADDIDQPAQLLSSAQLEVLRDGCE